MTQPEQAVEREHVRHAAAAGRTLLDRRWVGRALADDRAAEEQLYRSHIHVVLRLAHRLLGRSSEADDVAQDAFISAFTRLHQLRDEQLFRGWLLRITAREAHRHHRRRRQQARLNDALGHAGLFGERACTRDAPELRAELARLDRVLAQLPLRERVVWQLRHVEGRELCEIAASCRVSLATVKRWLARAQTQVAAHASAGRRPPSRQCRTSS